MNHLTLPRLGVKMIPRTKYLHTKSKLYIVNSSNSLNIRNFQIVFRKNNFPNLAGLQRVLLRRHILYHVFYTL